MVRRAPALRALLLLSAAGRVCGVAQVELSSIDAEDPLVDEVLCPMSLIQTTLRQVRLRDGVAEEIGLPPAAAAAGLASGAPGIPAVGRGEAVGQLPRSSRSDELPQGAQNVLERLKMDVHGLVLGSGLRGSGRHQGVPTPAAVVQPAVLQEVEHHSRGNRSVSNFSARIAKSDRLAPGTNTSRSPAEVSGVHKLGLAAGHAASSAVEAAAEHAVAGAAAARLAGASRGGGLRVSHLRLAARRDIRVLVMLVVLVLLLAITTIMSVRSVFVGMRRRGEGSARERAVKAIPLCSIHEVERQLPSAGGGYDCALARPLSVGRPLRFEARVLGPACGTTLVGPLTQRPCVLYEASVTRPAGAQGRAEAVARCSRSADFMVALLDAPEVQVELRGEDVSLFGMQDGLCVERRPLASGPEHWATFAAAHRLPSAEEASEEEVLDFREAALLVGSLVTLVGDLHRGVTGALSLWPWHGEAGEAKPKETPDAEEGRRVLEPWRTSWERSISHNAEEAEEDEELRFGAVLASDDPALLAAAERHCCGPWWRVRALLLGRAPGWRMGVDGPKSGS